MMCRKNYLKGFPSVAAAPRYRTLRTFLAGTVELADSIGKQGAIFALAMCIG